jgi:hypothetical protein
LCPGPVSRHEVTITSLIVLKFAVRSVVDATGKVGVGKDIMDDLPGVTVPDLIIGGHPFRRGCVVWTEAIVSGSVGLPGYVAKFDGVDRCMKFMVVFNWCGVIVRDERSTPDT